MARGDDAVVERACDLVGFLLGRNQHSLAADRAAALLAHCRGARGIPEPHMARVLFLTARACGSIGRHGEAEPLFRESLAMRRRLAEASPEAYEFDLATSCNGLAC